VDSKTGRELWYAVAWQQQTMSLTVHTCQTTKFTTLFHYNVIKNNENRSTFIPEVNL